MSTMGDIGCQLLGIALGGAYVLGASCATAQITPDRTLPTNSNVTINGSVFNITGGTQAGRNLFHSFQQFSVPTGSTASFNNGLDIQNIISRVTGGEVSSIDGLIKASGTANLFFLNPNGIVFGRNASLSIGGSFVASTANSLKFADGFEFSATSLSLTPLLTISVPIGLQYGTNPGSITNQSIAVDANNNPVGLMVSPGNTLALVGGDVSLDGGKLTAAGGRVELGGLAAPGTVGLQANGSNLSLSFPDNLTRANVSLGNGGYANVAAGGGGSIAVNANNLNITSGSQLNAGIAPGMGSVTANAGDIMLNATGDIKIDGSGSIIRNNVGALNNTQNNLTKGNGGNIEINTPQLELTNGAQLQAVTFGQGNAGNVTINARDTVSFDGAIPDVNDSSSGIESIAQQGSTGNAGNISINTGTLSLTNGAVVNAISYGQGTTGSVTINASDHVSLDGSESAVNNFLINPNSRGNSGGISITTGTLSITNRAQLNTSSFGMGNAGDVTINARDRVSFNNGRVFTSTNEETTGNGGNISITSGDISLANGSLIVFSTFGQGNAGNALLTSRSLSLTDGSQLILSTFGQGNAGSLKVNASNSVVLSGTSPDGISSGLSTTSASNATGAAGSLTIKTPTLQVRDGAGVSTSTLGEGSTGNIMISTDTTSLDGAKSVVSNTSGANLAPTVSIRFNGQSSPIVTLEPFQGTRFANAIGNSGNINIKTDSLTVGNGAQLTTNTFGQGNAGNISVNTHNATFSGTDTNGYPSGAFSAVQPGASGNGGAIRITTDKLTVEKGAQLGASTFGNGNAGNIMIDGNEISFNGVSGNTPSGAFSSIGFGGVGSGGNVNITTGSLSVTNGAQVSANTNIRGQGEAGSINILASGTVLIDGFPSSISSAAETGAVGNGGNLRINARSIRLNNDALLSANTRSNTTNPNLNVEQARIALYSEDLILSRGSNITTNAKGSNVIGGDINIDTDVLAAVENSFISANSTDFRGGRVIINASGVFRSRESTITATGVNSQSNGTVQISNPEVDPSRGLVTLPTVTEIAPRLVSSSCAAFADVGGSNFIVTGRSGLPPSPDEPLSSDVVWTDTRLPVTTALHQHRTHAAKSKPQLITIIPATGWVLNDLGEVTLISSVTNASTLNTPTSCPVK